MTKFQKLPACAARSSQYTQSNPLNGVYADSQCTFHIVRPASRCSFTLLLVTSTSHIALYLRCWMHSILRRFLPTPISCTPSVLATCFIVRFCSHTYLSNLVMARNESYDCNPSCNPRAWLHLRYAPYLGNRLHRSVRCDTAVGRPPHHAHTYCLKGLPMHRGWVSIRCFANLVGVIVLPRCSPVQAMDPFCWCATTW